MAKHALNPQQKAAVDYLDGPLLVLAGAGSGKTRVITEKIAHLINERGIAPRHIVAVTFTNKAAREMKTRVGDLMTRGSTRGLTVSTFHRLGLNILRREHAHLGLKGQFSLYDGGDASALLLELLKRDAGTDKGHIDMVRGRISSWKNALVEPEQAIACASDEQETACAMAYAAYERQLRSYNAVDLDDLLRLPVRLFEQQPEVLEHWQGRVRYMLIDEYQDTNSAQYRLVLLLTRMRQALTVVGDDDQSIYAWRGAQPENLAQLKSDFPNLKVVKLEQNYRSTNIILQAANALIAHNPHVFDKRLWSESAGGDRIRVIECRNEQHEAERVVGDIVHHRFQGAARYSDYAILFRGNHQARIFEKALREQGVPYVLSGGQSFFSYSEIKDMLAYLKLLANLDDSGAFLRIANTPRREIGPGTLEKLTRFAGEHNCSLVDACFDEALDTVLAARQRRNVREFADWLVATSDRCANTGAAVILADMISDIDYESWLRGQHEEPVAERRIANINELTAWIRKMGGDSEQDITLQELVNRLTLMDILDRADSDEIGDRVALMTLHAAKGLEFSQVYLVGMEENLLPHRASIEQDDIEEERRVAYVGITRAQKGLTLSMARARKRHGDVEQCEPSRFIEELPEQHLHWVGGRHEADPQREKEYGAAHLANLKGLLA